MEIIAGLGLFLIMLWFIIMAASLLVIAWGWVSEHLDSEDKETETESEDDDHGYL